VLSYLADTTLAGAKTQRERDYKRDYIAAIETFYRDADKLDHRTRALAYERSYGRVGELSCLYSPGEAVSPAYLNLPN